jgi:hypothetical protein
VDNHNRRGWFGSARERILAIAAGLVIGGFVIAFWIVQPLAGRVSAGRDTVEAQQTRLDSVKRLLGQAQHIEAAHTALSAFLIRDAQGFSTHAFLDRLEVLSSHYALQMNLKPRGMRVEDKVQFFEVELEIQGRQDAVLGFVDELMGLEALLTVERLRVANAPTREHLLKGSLLLRQIIPET